VDWVLGGLAETQKFDLKKSLVKKPAETGEMMMLEDGFRV
jgi:hypothetical protein